MAEKRPGRVDHTQADRVRAMAGWLLLIIGGFQAISAFVGGVALVTVGIPVPLDQIAPFTSFLWPGILLGVVIGGTQVVAVVAQRRRHRWWPVGVAVAGFGMVIWIFVELALMGEYYVLHGVYMATGLLQIGLLLVALGVLEPA